MDASLWDLLKNIVVYPIVGIMGWLLKSKNDEIKDLREEITMIKIENAGIKEQLKNITIRLDEIKILMNILVTNKTNDK